MNVTSRITLPFVALTCAALIVLTCASVYAQSNLGGISGTVTDASGAVVPNAVVTITNVGANRSFRLTTSESGAYSLPNLEPVVYRIRVEAAGFKAALVENVKVDTASAATVNVTLEVGAASETVNITSEAALINVESGAQNATLTERMIRDLPVANRNVLELALTVPNVAGLVGTEDPEITTGTPRKIFGPLGYDSHDRTFFFASFEPRWRSDGESQYFLVPDEGMRRGDFSSAVLVPGGYVRREVADRLGVRPTGDYVVYRQFNLVGNQLQRLALQPGQTFPQFPNNVIPSNFLDPVSRTLLQYMPPGGDYFLLNGQVRNLVSDRNVKINEKRYSIRFDQAISDNNRFNLRYTTVPIFGERGRGAQDFVVNAQQLNLPLTPTGSGAQPTADYQRALAITRNARKGATAGPLPADFFSMPIPRGFTTTNANTFDIRTEHGLKLYRLRNAFNPAEFGILGEKKGWHHGSLVGLRVLRATIVDYDKKQGCK